MSSKIEKVIKITERQDKRLNELELNKLDEENIMNKLLDLAGIASANTGDILALKEQINFLSDLMDSIGRKLDINSLNELSEKTSLYS